MVLQQVFVTLVNKSKSSSLWVVGFFVMVKNSVIIKTMIAMETIEKLSKEKAPHDNGLSGRGFRAV